MKRLIIFMTAVVGIIALSACSTDKNINRAKMSAAEYWTNKAYPGKAYDVQVTDAEKVEDGKYRVKAVVDGEERVGLYNPETETFDEGYYTMAHEKMRKVAEMEQEVSYLKERVAKLEKENYQLKLRLKYVKAGHEDPNLVVDPDTTTSDDDSDDDVQPVKKAKTAPVPAAAAAAPTSTPAPKSP